MRNTLIRYLEPTQQKCFEKQRFETCKEKFVQVKPPVAERTSALTLPVTPFRRRLKTKGTFHGSLYETLGIANLGLFTQSFNES